MWGGRSRITPALCMLAMSIATIAMIPNVIRMSDEAVAQSAPSSEIAPHGNLRVALLASNPILMTQKANGSIGGISVDLGRLIAERLRVQFDPVSTLMRTPMPKASDGNYGTLPLAQEL